MSFVDDSEYEIGDLKSQIENLKKTQVELIGSINILHAIEAQQKATIAQLRAENEGHKIIEAQQEHNFEEALAILKPLAYKKNVEDVNYFDLVAVTHFVEDHTEPMR
jgi:hypothetical protein